MILAVHTASANGHDSRDLVPLVKKVSAQHRQEILADREYKSGANDELLAACSSPVTRHAHWAIVTA